MSRSGGRSDGGFSNLQLSGPASNFGESMPRWAANADLTALASGTLFMVGIPLPAGIPVTNVTFVAGATATGTFTHQYGALYSPARARLAVSADGGAGAWAANTAKTFAMQAAFTTTVAGFYYLGLLVVLSAGSAPSLRGAAAPSNTVALNIAPIACGTADAGLSGVAAPPDPAAAITVTANWPYAYIT